MSMFVFVFINVFKFFLKLLFFIVFLDHFDILILKINFLKYYFNIF